MVGTVGSGFRVAEPCDSRQAFAYPFGHGCDDSVAANSVAVGVGDVDDLAVVGDAMGGVVVGPAHKALTLKRREAPNDGSVTTSADGTGGFRLKRFGNLAFVADAVVAGVFGVE